MNLNEIINGDKCEKQFLLGNESTVRALIESNVGVATTYPGTPSSEIGDILSKIAKDVKISFEFSANEKIALEIAAAASVSGIRSFTFMKHVGVNVAADSFISLLYSGTRAGMVILSADDPSIFSSQNEQDNRHYSRLANIPTLEPSNPQELKDYIKLAYDLSEKYKLPILIRTTTRVSHMRGIVELDKTKIEEKIGFFHKDPHSLVPVPAPAREMHKKLTEKIEKVENITNNTKINTIHYKNQKINLQDLNQNTEIRIITSGSSFNHTYDVINELKLDIPILKLGFTYPFPDILVLNFLKNIKKVIVIEETDPIMEKEILKVIGQNNLNISVHGKLDKTLPLIYEYTPDIIKKRLNKLLKLNIKENILKTNLELPKRSANLCPGCPHRATYYAVKKARKNLNVHINDLIYPTDIGCYTLGIGAPYHTADYLLAMGSSVGTSCGFSQATDQKIVSFIGDSTFFHSGIPPLLNAVHNDANFVLTILDNRITAMTGGQSNPGLTVNSVGDPSPAISIENVVNSIGVELVNIVNPLNINKTINIYEEAINFDGVSVVITRHPCVLINKNRKDISIVIDQNKCLKCRECIDALGCSAIYEDANNDIVIDENMCTNCTVCIQICPNKAIKQG